MKMDKWSIRSGNFWTTVRTNSYARPKLLIAKSLKEKSVLRYETEFFWTLEINISRSGYKKCSKILKNKWNKK